MDRTTNYNLKKPSTGDPVLVGDLNDNMDVIDTQLNAITDGIAIIANGNTHAAIAKDQAVFVKNHSSLANGLYWATAAISANGALSTSNLTADTSGGLNKLHDDITTLNSKITNRVITKDIAVTFNNETDVSVDAASILESGKDINDIESIYCFERYSATPIWLAYSGGNNKFHFISNISRNFNAYMRVVVCYKIG